jgi:preprotein translocase subunit SecA
VLNAKQHEREAHIVEHAGHQQVNAHGEHVGNVTIATNMAGRGTDIKLSPEAFKAGGLHVIGTERHTARRIDNQLRGRSGRQGDAGSSQFYVSLQDDLMKMFAGDWTIKVLGWLGMQEGEAIQDKRISKGIIRAQKKVEERNYLARKNLLEYDEVNDHHRTSFYGMRQKVLEGEQIGDVIWGMIGEAVDDAVERFITKDYIAVVVAEWAQTNFGFQIEADEIKGMRHYDDLCDYIKNQAEAEADTRIGTDLQEFLGEDVTDSKGWDTKGISSWAMSRFSINLPQSQIRKMDAEELQETIRVAAIEQIEKRDCSPILKYLQPLYAEGELAAWARDKFAIEIDPQELLEDEKNQVRKGAAEIATLIEDRARQAYARREIEYPVEHILTFVFGGADAVTDNPYAADFLRSWVKAKYGIDLSIDHIRASSPRQLREELIGYQRSYLAEGKLEADIDRILAEAGNDRDKALAAFQARFPMPPEPPRTKSDGQAVVEQPLRQQLLTRARQFLRRELTDLEQFVLIQILDQSWKDHLYAMDMLKSSIGLQAFAEQDPRVLYKKEGYEFFEQMMAGVRDKVTDLIFRARVTGQAQSRSAYRETAAVHEGGGGYGVAENIIATADATQGSPSELNEEVEVGSGGGGEAAPVQTIVRQAPRVGRNDPCPCGSGKKYKKCCGVNAA